MPLLKPSTRRLILIAIDAPAPFGPADVSVTVKRMPPGAMASIEVMDFRRALRSAADRTDHELGSTLVEMRDELDRHAERPR